MPFSKEKKQVLLLSVVLACIAGALLWMYGGRLLPTPDAMRTLTPFSRVELPARFDDPLFERADYKALRGVAGVPVKPFTEIPRNTDPFKERE